MPGVTESLGDCLIAFAGRSRNTIVTARIGISSTKGAYERGVDRLSEALLNVRKPRFLRLFLSFSFLFFSPTLDGSDCKMNETVVFET